MRYIVIFFIAMIYVQCDQGGPSKPKAKLNFSIPLRGTWKSTVVVLIVLR